MGKALATLGLRRLTVPNLTQARILSYNERLTGFIPYFNIARHELKTDYSGYAPHAGVAKKDDERDYSRPAGNGKGRA